MTKNDLPTLRQLARNTNQINYSDHALKQMRSRGYKMDDVEKMARLQKQILQNAKKLLKDNGIILYSTCSLSKKEGEKQINEFIQENTNFVVKPISLDDVSFSYTKDGFLRILPQHFQIFYGADGFFVACLQRIN